MKRENEYQTLSIRAAKPVSAAGLVMSIFLLLFGIGFAIVVGNVLFDNEAPFGLAILFFIFMIGWLAAALFILIYHVRNLRRPAGEPIFQVDVLPGHSQGTAEPNRSVSP